MIGYDNMFPPAVKNLLFINIIIYIAVTYVLPDMGMDIRRDIPLYHWESPFFRPWQFLTSIFMHGNESHLLFNMFTLWIFGHTMENYWGTKRFINYYLLTGFGAALLHYLMINFQMVALRDSISPMDLETIRSGMVPMTESVEIQKYIRAIVTPVVGASGAVYGILIALGMTFPDRQINLYFIFPIKIKYLVMIYGSFALYRGIQANPDGIAHFAHMGGLIFGFIAINYWRKNNSNFY